MSGWSPRAVRGDGPLGTEDRDPPIGSRLEARRAVVLDDFLDTGVLARFNADIDARLES